PSYQGSTGHMFGYQSLPITSRGDVSLVCGTYMVPEVFPELGNIFAKGAKVVHIDLNAYEIAKSHPVTLGLVSDPKLTLARLATALESALGPSQRSAAASRTAALARAKAERLAAAKEADRKVRGQVPLHFSRFTEDLASRLPADAVVFDEALTCSPPLTRYW